MRVEDQAAERPSAPRRAPPGHHAAHPGHRRRARLQPDFPCEVWRM